ncbi:hypothetical protein VHEMI08147 [[Torrubiella] hemipterigena]|uniref:Carboxymuconolactone decarboxylase-like domain-containing protein n=1 Tax=[Torrubiella] hemipterigena TaxID=1531966 RepID=A0A0A1T5P2_9HYPO|nr:hypothetical protein VHEMI08147 [[Torrubiella] hemipterigena]
MSSKQGSSIVTSDLIVKIENTPDLPPDTWYLICAAVLCALNEPTEVAALLKHLIHDAEGDLTEQKRLATRYREALIKIAPLSGMPKTINSLLALKRVTPPELLDDASTQTTRTKDFTETPAADVLARGKDFFGVVYGSKASSMMKVLDSCGTPDLGAAARLMYAFFPSNTSVLSGAETMCVSFVGAIAVDVQDVALNHMRGAVNHGASVRQVNAVREAAVVLCETVISCQDGKSRGYVARL